MVKVAHLNLRLGPLRGDTQDNKLEIYKNIEMPVDQRTYTSTLLLPTLA